MQENTGFVSLISCILLANNMKKLLFTCLFVIILGGFAEAQQKACPKLRIIEPAFAVKPGERLIFEVNSTETPDLKKSTFNWTVNQGKIVEGQGTRKIAVDTNGLRETTVTATLRVSACRHPVTGTGVVMDILPLRTDEFGRISVLELFHRVDQIFIEAQNDPASNGLIVNFGPLDEVENREKLIAYHVSIRGYDASRYSFARGEKEARIRTQIWFVPKDVDQETLCDDCKFIDAKEIKFDKTNLAKKIKAAICPSSVAILEPAVAVAPGENLTFTAEVKGDGDYSDIGYKWLVSNGEIVEGQGTSTILVALHTSERSITTRVEITGLLDECRYIKNALGSLIVSHSRRSAEQDIQVCPRIEVLEPETPVWPGEDIKFSAMLQNVNQYKNLEYIWAIDKGTIITDPGAQTIEVSTSGVNPDTVLTASLIVKGLPEKCSNTAKGAALVIRGGDPLVLDEFGKMHHRDVKARIDVLLEELKKDSTKLQGLIINYGKKSAKRRRVKLIKRHIKKKKLEHLKIVFLDRGVEKTIRTRLWIVPAGADTSVID